MIIRQWPTTVHATDVHCCIIIMNDADDAINVSQLSEQYSFVTFLLSNGCYAI